MVPFHRSWPIHEAVRIACVMEAAAPKLGNVHPGASFADMRFEHFVASASAISECFRDTPNVGVGEQVLSSVQQMRSACQTNTHLGTILLLAPLASAIHCCKQRSSGTLADLKAEIDATLTGLMPQDCANVYEAIQLTRPGGLGSTDQADVSEQPPDSLVDAMRLAPRHDSVAQQYVNGFADIFDGVLPCLESQMRDRDPLQAITLTQLDWLAEHLDGLIVRKAGEQVAQDIRARTAGVRNYYQELPVDSRPKLSNTSEWQKLDASMRCPANRLNPGTTADLIAAALFVRLCGFSSHGRS